MRPQDVHHGTPRAFCIMHPKDVHHVAHRAMHHSAACRGSCSLPGLGRAQRTFPLAPQRAKKHKHSSAKGAPCAPIQHLLLFVHSPQYKETDL